MNKLRTFKVELQDINHVFVVLAADKQHAYTNAVTMSRRPPNKMPLLVSCEELHHKVGSTVRSAFATSR